MTIALDVGSGSLKSLRHEQGRLVARSASSVYALLPESATTRKVLDRLHIPFAECEDALLLLGDAAVEYAPVFQSLCAPLLPGGRLAESDPPARQILSVLVDGLLPVPTSNKPICCLTVPHQGRGHADPEYEFLTRLVALRGYEPMVLSGGTAAVLAAGAKEAFTGIGMTFGAATSEVCVVHRGREVAGCAVPCGGDWIDEQLALAEGQFTWDRHGRGYLAVEAVRQWKHACSEASRGEHPQRRRHLIELAEQMLARVLGTAAERLSAEPAVSRLPQPLAVFCTGGTTRIPQFRDLLATALARAALPLELAAVHIAGEPRYTVSRGCLIRAELETEARKCQQRTAA